MYKFKALLPLYIENEHALYIFRIKGKKEEAILFGSVSTSMSCGRHFNRNLSALNIAISSKILCFVQPMIGSQNSDIISKNL